MRRRLRGTEVYPLTQMRKYEESPKLSTKYRNFNTHIWFFSVDSIVGRREKNTYRMPSFLRKITADTSEAGPPQDLILRQSFMKQQSVWGQNPFEWPKHGMQPSATWMAWMSSAFFILPGFSPRALAFILMSGKVIRLSVTSVVGMCLSPFDFIRGVTPRMKFLSERQSECLKISRYHA